MRVLLFVLMMLTAIPAGAQQGADPAAIQSVIDRQLEAFRHDDGAGAFGLASPMIQQMFATPSNFLAMVAQGYAPVYRAHGVTYGPLATLEGRLVQQVELSGPDGRRYLALYTMEKQPDGNWKVNGCELTELQSTSA